MIKNVIAAIIGIGLLININAGEMYAQSAEGDSGAKVVLTEFSDFQCPACGHYYPIVKKLKKEYGDDLKVNYRHFPLNSHQFAALAARAAEAARKQGKFKEMHDLLFETQSLWAQSTNPQAIFVEYARSLELDIDRFKEDLNSAEMQRIVMEEKKEGEKMGVRATPTFFINGEEVDPLPRTYEDFKAVVESYMRETN